LLPPAAAHSVGDKFARYLGLEKLSVNALSSIPLSKLLQAYKNTLHDAVNKKSKAKTGSIPSFFDVDFSQGPFLTSPFFPCSAEPLFPDGSNAFGNLLNGNCAADSIPLLLGMLHPNARRLKYIGKTNVISASTKATHTNVLTHKQALIDSIGDTRHSMFLPVQSDTSEFAGNVISTLCQQVRSEMKAKYSPKFSKSDTHNFLCHSHFLEVPTTCTIPRSRPSSPKLTEDDEFVMSIAHFLWDDDRTVGVPALRLADAHCSLNSMEKYGTFVFRIDWAAIPLSFVVPKSQSSRTVGFDDIICNAFDMFDRFLRDKFNNYSHQLNSTDEGVKLAFHLSQSFFEFIKHGDPSTNSFHFPRWDQYNEDVSMKITSKVASANANSDVIGPIQRPFPEKCASNQRTVKYVTVKCGCMVVYGTSDLKFSVAVEKEFDVDTQTHSSFHVRNPTSRVGLLKRTYGLLWSETNEDDIVWNSSAFDDNEIEKSYIGTKSKNSARIPSRETSYVRSHGALEASFD
jgi:hypothetical protein